MRQLRIGELADQFHLNPKTIRYYERVGLLTPDDRSAGGYRLYDAGAIWRLEFILKAKALGLTLQEIREILTLRDRGESPCERVLALTDHKISSIEAQVRALSDFREDLLRLRTEAGHTRSAEACVCGIIEQHQPQGGAERSRTMAVKRPTL